MEPEGIRKAEKRQGSPADRRCIILYEMIRVQDGLDLPS